jgi:hypothetical protein
MRKFLVVLLVVMFATVGIVAQATAAAQEKKGGAKDDRWSGIIQRSNKDQSNLTVRRGNIERTVVYDSNTKWTKEGNKPADMGDFKDGARVICMGKYDEKGRLMATRIDLRAPR